MEVPLHNWYNTTAKENFSGIPGLASVFQAPASGSLEFPNYIQNHESESKSQLTRKKNMLNLIKKLEIYV